MGDVVSMNATATTDDKALTTASYTWDFDGDGQYDDATGVTPTTTFATAGAKTIALRVTDSDNAAATVTHPVTVLANAAPVARATFTPARPNPAATVTFNASTSTDDDPLPAGAYAWDFDNDGQYDDGTGISATTTFAGSGTKTVGLRVTDADTPPLAGTATISVPVNRAPTAAFNLSPQTPRVGETVTFTSAASDDVALPAATTTGPRNSDGRIAVGRLIGFDEESRAAQIALIELGRRVCTPKSPACPRCPLATWCKSATDRYRQIPNRVPGPGVAFAARSRRH